MGEFAPERRIIPRADGSDVELRQLVPQDAEAYFDLVEHDRDHLRQFDEPTGDKYRSPGEVEDSILIPPDPTKLRFGIWHYEADAVEPKMVGSINLMPMGEHMQTHERMAAVGWWVGKEHIGHGYASKACEPLIEYAFGVLGVDMVFCKIRADNMASIRTAERTGFTYESMSPAGIATYIRRKLAQ